MTILLCFCSGQPELLSLASGFRGKPNYKHLNLWRETIMEKTLALVASLVGIVVSVALFASVAMA